jgi:hypothetical protein
VDELWKFGRRSSQSLNTCSQPRIRGIISLPHITWTRSIIFRLQLQQLETQATQRQQRSIQAGRHVQTQRAPAVAESGRKIGAKKIERTTNSSSRYFDTAICSPKPFLRRVLRTRSLASACPEAGSRGRSLILVSVGSPVLMLNSQANIRENRTHLERLTNGQTSVDKTPVLVWPFSSLSRTH